MIASFLVIVAMAAWLLAMTLSFIKGVDVRVNDGDTRIMWAWFLVSFLILSVPLSYVISSMEGDEHSNTLCLHGHQEWIRTGKTTTKHWACDNWEVR